MKRIVYLLLFTASVMMTFTSCFKGSGYEEGPLDPGKAIFNAAYSQHTHAIEPVNFAFRLNVLLNEAIDQGVAIDNLAALKAMELQIEDIEGDKSVFNKVFQRSQTRAQLESIENGVYTIHFGDDSSNPYFYRLGRIIINTGGLTLEELENSSSWTISLAGVAGNETFNYYEYNEVISVSKDVEYGIFASGDRYWEVISNEYVAVSSIYKFESKWDLNFKITQEGGLGMNVANTYDSIFRIYGSGAGYTMTGDEMSYEIPDSNPMKCIPACDPDYDKYMVESGTEEASFTGEYNAEYYESPSAKRVWKAGTTSCSTTYTFFYNGHSGQ